MPKENIRSTCDVVEGGGGDYRTPKEVSGIVQILSRPTLNDNLKELQVIE